MLDRTKTKFSHVKPDDTDYVAGGLRDFFLYRDLGVADATNGKVIAHLVKANMAPEKGTGWHRHEADFQIVIMLKGWARFMYEDKETLVSAGDCVHQRPGIKHFLFDYSPDWNTWRSSHRPTSSRSTSSRSARSRIQRPGDQEPAKVVIPGLTRDPCGPGVDRASCRCRMPASCAASIRGSCSSRLSSA
ncbi:MAG: cupin [Ramlibacter sp.]|nr:cupin [Ramlibacter sp.]